MRMNFPREGCEKDKNLLKEDDKMNIYKKMDLQLFADASAQLQNTTATSGMSAEMKTYYEKTRRCRRPPSP